MVLFSAFFFSKLAKYLLFFHPPKQLALLILICNHQFFSIREFNSAVFVSISCFSKSNVELFKVSFIVLFKFSISFVNCFSSLHVSVSFFFFDPLIRF